MILFAHVSLTILTALVQVIDWVADRFEREEELHPFLREDPRPIQVRGRPRRLT